MSLSTRLVLATVLVALLTGAGVGLSIGPIQASLSPLELQARQREVDELGATFTDGLDEIVRITHLMRAAAAVEATVELHDPRVTTEVFSTLLRTYPDLLQARIISVAGVGPELVRVDRQRIGGPIRIVPPDELQAKGHRPYILSAMAAAPGEVVVGAIEPNEEHGAIEMPLRPVLRAATPVWLEGELRAVIVFNLDMTQRLARLAEGSPGTQVYLQNGEGHFVVHPDPAARFGGAAPDFAWAEDLGEGPDSAVITHGPSGHLVIVARRTLRPGGGEPVQLVSVGPAPQIAAIRRTRELLWTAVLGATVFAAILAILIARQVSRPLAKIAATAEAYPDTSAPLPLEAAGEVGAVARALDRMNEAVRQREDALRRGEARFRQLFDASPTPLTLVDATGRIQLANERAIALLGYSGVALTGMRVTQLVPEASRAHHDDLVQSFVAAPASRLLGHGQDLACVRRDGTIVPVEIGLSPIEVDGEFQILASLVDLTERRQQELALRRSNEDLEHFASVASHDLQEPLRNVANFAELLAKRYTGKLDDKADVYIGFMVDGARRMQNLVSDLLAYSRVGGRVPELRPVCLDRPLDLALKTLEASLRAAEAKIERDPLPTLRVDPRMMEQVFTNLLSNAVKFRGDTAAHIEIRAQPEGEGWQLTVRDHGLGMDMADAERVFKMFERLHARSEYEGSGIGLAIVRRVVERHGGRVWLESAPAEGTSIHFTLAHPKEPTT